MTSLKQNIKTVLTDVETFLVETLKSVKLNSSAKDSKVRLLEKVRQLLEEITGSSSGQLDSSASGGSHKISGGGDSGSGGGSASNLQSTGGEESGYGEDITKIAASDLKNKLQAGLLERKKKSGFKSWEQVYCVVSNNIFYIYKKQGDSKQKVAFCLNGYEFQAAPGLEKDASKKEMCFELVKAGTHTYHFRAASVEGMTHWREAITKGIQMVADEEDGELYDQLDQFPGTHSYGTLTRPSKADPDDEEGYENITNTDGVPSKAKASTLPQANQLPQQHRPKTEAGYYQNVPSAKGASKPEDNKGVEKGACPKPLSGVKTHEEPPPMIDIFEGASPGESSVRPKVKEVVAQEITPVSLKGTKAASRMSLPVGVKLGGSSSTVIYDDCTEGPIIPAGNRRAVKGANPNPTPSNPYKGRELPQPPPAAASEPMRPKSELGARKAGGSPPSPQSSDLPTAQAVKNLRSLFE